MSQTETTVEPAVDGSACYMVKGDLTLDQVVALQKRTQKLWSDQAGIDVDLSQVGRADSAGLALIIEWTKTARQRGAEIRFFNLPEQLAAMARVSGLETILPIFRNTPH